MTNLQKIEQAAVVLSAEDRASLVAYLLNTLDVPEYDVSDEDVMRRDEELDSGKQVAISHAEFLDAFKRSV